MNNVHVAAFSSGLCPEIMCVCTCVCKLCFVCMCGSVVLHLINTNFRVNNYFMNLFYLKKQPLGSGQGHGLYETYYRYSYIVI